MNSLAPTGRASCGDVGPVQSVKVEFVYSLSAKRLGMRAPHSFSFCDSVLFETTKAQVKLLECLSFSSNRQEPSIDFILSKDRLFGKDWILVISIVRSWYISMQCTCLEWVKLNLWSSSRFVKGDLATWI